MTIARGDTLAASTARKDKEARFADFVQRHRQRAVSVAWRLLGNDRAAAEDVAQEAFLKAYKALPGFRDEASLDTWFYRILVRQVHNHGRWRGVRERWRSLWGKEEAQSVPAPGSDPGLQARIAAALETLSPGQREAFVLVHLEGFTIQEAAEALGRAPGTVKSHLHRALKGLRSALGDLYGAGG